VNTENLNAPFMVCGICLQPLSRFLPMNGAGEFTGEVVYQHPLYVEADHDPAPQPRAEHYEHQLDQVCDFCTSTDIRWRYTAPGIKMLALDSDNEPVQTHQSSSQWNACGPCAKCIQHRNQAGLIRRVKAAIAAATGDEAEDIASAMSGGFIEAFFLTVQPGRDHIRRNRG
jgi:hypothetical protein